MPVPRQQVDRTVDGVVVVVAVVVAEVEAEAHGHLLALGVGDLQVPVEQVVVGPLGGDSPVQVRQRQGGIFSFINHRPGVLATARNE